MSRASLIYSSVSKEMRFVDVRALATLLGELLLVILMVTGSIVPSIIAPSLRLIFTNVTFGSILSLVLILLTAVAAAGSLWMACRALSQGIESQYGSFITTEGLAQFSSAEEAKSVMGSVNEADVEADALVQSYSIAKALEKKRQFLRIAQLCMFCSIAFAFLLVLVYYLNI